MHKLKLGLVPAYLVFMVAGLFSISSQAVAITIFVDDKPSWDLAVGAATTIEFENPPPPPFPHEVQGDEFNGYPGGPVFTLRAGDLMLAGDTFDEFNSFTPPNAFYPLTTISGENPADNMDVAIGIIRVVFDMPVSALGAYFLDVGQTFNVTGFDLHGDGSLDVNFPNFFPDGSQTFLGFTTTETSLSVIDIHFGGQFINESGGTVYDNVAIDDMSYRLAAAPPPVPTPEPASLALFGIGIAGFGFARRRRLR